MVLSDSRAPYLINTFPLMKFMQQPIVIKQTPLTITVVIWTHFYYTRNFPVSAFVCRPSSPSPLPFLSHRIIAAPQERPILNHPKSISFLKHPPTHGDAMGCCCWKRLKAQSSLARSQSVELKILISHLSILFPIGGTILFSVFVWAPPVIEGTDGRRTEVERISDRRTWAKCVT